MYSPGSRESRGRYGWCGTFPPSQKALQGRAGLGGRIWALGEVSPFVLHLWAPVSSLERGHPHGHTEKKQREELGQDHREPTSMTCSPLRVCSVAGAPSVLQGAAEVHGPTGPELFRVKATRPRAACPSAPQRGRPYRIHIHLSPLSSGPHMRACSLGQCCLPTESPPATRPTSGRAVVSGPESHLNQSHQRQGLPGPQARGPAHPRRPGGTECWAGRTEGVTAEQATYLGQWGRRASGDGCWRSV